MSSKRRENAYRRIDLKKQASFSFGKALSFCAVITADNTADAILDSLLAQTVRFSEVLVSADALSKKALRKAASDKRVHLSVNSGELNKAQGETKCDCTVLVSAPAKPDMLFRLRAAIELHPDDSVFTFGGEKPYATALRTSDGKPQSGVKPVELGERPAVTALTETAARNRKGAKICAGMVLLNADPEHSSATAENILGQVDRFIFADNGSENIEAFAERFRGDSRVSIIRNGENKGIAYALNRILETAYAEGYDWVLTLDQDTVCDGNMINVYSRYIHMDKLGIISPFIIHKGKCTPEEYLAIPKLETEFIHTYDRCITAASLTNVKAAKEVGGFNDELFIDAVDFDLNHRLLKSGYGILRANDTYIVQQIGERVPIKLYDLIYRFIGDRKYHGPKYFSVHSDFRLYYIARNYKWFLRKYKENSPTVNRCANFKDMLLRFLLYPKGRSRMKMLKAIRRGHRDSKKMTY